MSKIDPKVLREAQLIMLDSLIEFDKICKKYSFNYWLDSGTLLGAIRHKGFIPWDDDIDISMPIEDYIEFAKIAPKELPKDMFLQNKITDPTFPFDYMKIRSNRAKIIEFHEKDKKIEYHQGVFVDIFPMLNIENTKLNYQLYNDIFKLIRAVSPISLHTPNSKDMPKVRNKLQEALSYMHKRGDRKVIYGGEMPDVSAWFDYNKIFPLKKIEFEGLEFLSPNNPHHYLENIYSFNYMQLPPIDKRSTHADKVLINS